MTTILVRDQPIPQAWTLDSVTDEQIAAAGGQTEGFFRKFTKPDHRSGKPFFRAELSERAGILLGGPATIRLGLRAPRVGATGLSEWLDDPLGQFETGTLATGELLTLQLLVPAYPLPAYSVYVTHNAQDGVPSDIDLNLRLEVEWLYS